MFNGEGVNKYSVHGIQRIHVGTASVYHRSKSYSILTFNIHSEEVCLASDQ